MYPNFEEAGNKDTNPYSQPKPAQKKGGMTKEYQVDNSVLKQLSMILNQDLV